MISPSRSLRRTSTLGGQTVESLYETYNVGHERTIAFDGRVSSPLTMEPDGEPRGTANSVTDGQRIDNTVTDGQRIDRLEDMVREIYSHFFSDRYPNGDTPGRSGNVSTGSMDFDAVKNAVDEESAVEIENAVDEESAAEIAIDEKSIVPTSDEESVVINVATGQRFISTKFVSDQWMESFDNTLSRVRVETNALPSHLFPFPVLCKATVLLLPCRRQTKFLKVAKEFLRGGFLLLLARNRCFLLLGTWFIMLVE